MKRNQSNSFKPLKLNPRLLRELQKEGLINIEQLDAKKVKILNDKNEKKNIIQKKKNEKKEGRNGITKTNEKKQEQKKDLKKEPSPNQEKLFKKVKNRKIQKKNAIKGKREKGKKKANNKKNKNEANKTKTKTNNVFDIQNIIETEQKLKNVNDVKFKSHVTKWTLHHQVPIQYNILKALQDHNFTAPFEIQTKTLTASICDKKDIIVISKTGTGKTLTMCLPILNNIVVNKLKEYQKGNACKPKFRALILVPTRELALQIMNHFQFVNTYIHINISTIIGGINVEKQKRIISKNPEILICTPGRLRFFLEQSSDDRKNKKRSLNDKDLMGPFQYIRDMKHVRYFACDELDKMVESSFKGNINIITKHLYRCLENKVKFLQTFLLSATLGLTAHIQNTELASLIKSIHIRKQKSLIINLSGDFQQEDQFNILPEGLSINIIKCSKQIVLLQLLFLLKWYFIRQEHVENKGNKEYMTSSKGHIKKIIIFVNTIVQAKELKSLFSILFFDPNLESNIPKKFKSNRSLQTPVHVYCVHSKLEQKKRLENIEKFADEKKGKCILISTDVLSRGIDLDSCDLIIQLNCPISDITFVHRSGRTARKFTMGKCICFITEEEIEKWIRAFEKLGLQLKDLQENEEIKNMKSKEYSTLNQAFKICKEIKELQEKVQVKSNSFINKLAKDADLTYEENDSNYSDEEEQYGKESTNAVYKKMKFLKANLFQLLYQK